jgi:hypothetical protein
LIVGIAVSIPLISVALVVPNDLTCLDGTENFNEVKSIGDTTLKG